MTLAEASTELAAARTESDPGRLAGSLIAWAEQAPLFRYRFAPVRGALVEASKLLPALGRPAWEGRCLLRLAEAQMVAHELAAARKLVDEAAARFAAANDEEG